MIDMLSTIPQHFPEIFTQKGVLRKQEPKRFKCTCGHMFTQTQTVRLSGMIFGVKVCPSCGERVKENPTYSVWKRMASNQIAIEDFILNVVSEQPAITKEALLAIVEEKFGKEQGALGHLAYFGYLQVDKEKRDTQNIIQYTINPEKNLNQRIERIQ